LYASRIGVDLNGLFIAGKGFAAFPSGTARNPGWSGPWRSRDFSPGRTCTLFRQRKIPLLLISQRQVKNESAGYCETNIEISPIAENQKESERSAGMAIRGHFLFLIHSPAAKMAAAAKRRRKGIRGSRCRRLPETG